MDTSTLTGRDPTDSNTPHNSYYIKLSVHGNRALLANETASPPRKMILTPIGNAVVAIWQTLSQHFPHIVTDAFYLVPDGICAIITVDAFSGGEIAVLRMLYRVISHFKAETTRVFNNTSSQDYHSRLWQTAFQCEIIGTSAQMTALQERLAAQGSYRICAFNSLDGK